MDPQPPIARWMMAGLVVGGAVLGGAAVELWRRDRMPAPAAAQAGAPPPADLQRLNTLIPSQSHAMIDVAYHWTNLWFAAEQQNWPLAQFYFNEARNHILWAIRIVPVRKTSGGDLHLQEMFDAFDQTLLTDLKKQIADHNRSGFGAAYRHAMNGCNACHAAAEKPYLHVVVPDRPEVHIVQFDPSKGH